MQEMGLTRIRSFNRFIAVDAYERDFCVRKRSDSSETVEFPTQT